MEEKNYFELLNSINVNDKTEKKNGLTYLSWAWAIGEITKQYPNLTYRIVKFENNLPYIYDEKTGYMVFTEVTIEGVTKEMWLPVMDSNNKAMLAHSYEYSTKYGTKTVEKATMFDINKTIMRCLAKNLAMFGLGLYIYAGEDLPEEERKENQIDQMDEKQLERIELETKCKTLGIDLKSNQTKTWIENKLQESTGRKELDEKFNLGQHNQILAFLIRSKEGKDDVK